MYKEKNYSRTNFKDQACREAALYSIWILFREESILIKDVPKGITLQKRFQKYYSHKRNHNEAMKEMINLQELHKHRAQSAIIKDQNWQTVDQFGWNSIKGQLVLMPKK